MVEPFGIRSSEGLFCLWSVESNSIRATEWSQGIVHCSWCYTPGPRSEVKTRLSTSGSGALPPCYRTGGGTAAAKVPAAMKERREPIGGERTNAGLRRPGGALDPERADSMDQVARLTNRPSLRAERTEKRGLPGGRAPPGPPFPSLPPLRGEGRWTPCLPDGETRD